MILVERHGRLRQVSCRPQYDFGKAITTLPDVVADVGEWLHAVADR
jgi:hypothetical protein